MSRKCDNSAIKIRFGVYRPEVGKFYYFAVKFLQGGDKTDIGAEKLLKCGATGK